MRIGFYAPLKSPNDETPSGDRAIARLFIKALKALGHKVELISELRSWQGTGDEESQLLIQSEAKNEVARLKTNYSKHPAPDLIFTYHVYHKAPDWIGVELAKLLSVPYIIAEASFAPKQENGLWHNGHIQTLKCIQSATAIISLNPVDSECIQPLIKHDQTIELIKPFLEPLPVAVENHQTQRKQLAGKYKLDTNKCWLIAVAMMRKGDKQASYKQLADVLATTKARLWHLLVIGDGEASVKIKHYFSVIDQRCIFLGKLEQRDIVKWLSVSDLFTWPAVNEAYGLALLEAQACGLPVVAQNFGGVGSIVEHSKTGFVTDSQSPEEFKHAVERLIEDEELRLQLARNAKHKFNNEHSFESASKKLNQILNKVIGSVKQ